MRTSGNCLLTLLLAVGATNRYLVEGQFDGSACTLSNGASGFCRLLDRCKPVLEALISGQRPDTLCGYQHITPIVCCSNERQTSSSARPVWESTGSPSRRPTTTTTTPAYTNPFAGSRPARRMCAEYARSVYALQELPVLLSRPQLANVSLCGIKSKKLIIGGTRAEPKEFPHMAAVGYQIDGGIQWKCGGTLVSDLFVLTAAHCLSTPLGPAYQVRLGDSNLYSDSEDARPQLRNIMQRIRHPNYKIPPKYNDIGLLKMDRPVELDAYVRPACLPLERTRAGAKAVATGWGVVDFLDDEGSRDLLKVTLPILSHEQCQKQYKVNSNVPKGIDANTQFCAGELNKDTCQGDSGGPLVVYSNEEECMYNVIGITSFGSFCGSSAGVSTAVYNYLQWIEEIVWRN